MTTLLLAYIFNLFVVNEKSIQNQAMGNSNQSSVIKAVEQNHLQDVEKALKNGAD